MSCNFHIYIHWFVDDVFWDVLVCDEINNVVMRIMIKIIYMTCVCYLCVSVLSVNEMDRSVCICYSMT